MNFNAKGISSIHFAQLIFCSVLRWSETKNLKILVIDNFFSCHLKVTKLCTAIKLGSTWSKLKSKFSIGHRFHGNRLIKLTKMCLKASFLERLMKEYE